MQVRHGEGVASHTGPESCACGREAASEALISENFMVYDLRSRADADDISSRWASLVAGEGARAMPTMLAAMQADAATRLELAYQVAKTRLKGQS